MKDLIKSLYRYLSSKHQTVFLDYPVKPRPRFAPHREMYAIANANRATYEDLLQRFLLHRHQLQSIVKSDLAMDDIQPVWNNGFLPGLDMVAIYGMVAEMKPNHIIEIGSGNSTKVARKAINDNSLKTKITSIDPCPRASIDHLSDTVIRKPLEDIENLQFIIDELNANDILFIDNSHRVFANSDAAICFMELMPRLKPGVIVHIHDIYLPYDYPQFMADRFYNEQYVLAAFILANPKRFETILPNYFISEDVSLAQLIAPMWGHQNLEGVEKHGGSYWLRINA